MEKDTKTLEHYIEIYKNNPENLTLSGKMRLINMLLEEREEEIIKMLK